MIKQMNKVAKNQFKQTLNRKLKKLNNKLMKDLFLMKILLQMDSKYIIRQYFMGIILLT